MNLAIIYPALVTLDGEKYGTRAYEHRQFPFLADHFERVDLVVFLRRGSLRPDDNELDGRRLRVLGLSAPTSGADLYKGLLRFWREVKRLFEQYATTWDVVLLYDPTIICQMAYLASRRYRIPTVLFLGGRHDLTVLANLGHRPLFSKLARAGLAEWYRMVIPWLGKRVPLVLTDERLLSFVGPHHQRYLIIVPTNVKQDTILTFEELERRQREVASFTLITVCRVVRVKGLEYLLAALDAIADPKLPIDLWIVGPQPDELYLAELQSYVLHKNLQERGVVVHFAGPVKPDDLVSYYDGADVLVISSVSEGSPKVIPEAFARGVPVVGTSVGGIPNLVRDGHNGFVVEPRDVSGLAGVLSRLRSDPALRKRLAYGARESAFSITADVQMSLLARFLQEVSRLPC